MRRRVVGLLLLTVIACGRESAGRTPAVQAPSHPSPSLPVSASATLPTNLPLFSSATCDTVAHAVPFPPSTRMTMNPDTVNMADVAKPETWPRRGCLIALEDTTASSGDAPNPSLEDWFSAHGWRGASWYSADGPDGTSFAYVLRERLCLVKGRWDGGDDSDSTYVPAPGFQLTIFCGPAIPADTAS